MASWQEIREKYPDQWVLVEAVDAKNIDGQRVFERMDLLRVCEDWRTAWAAYKEFKENHRDREYYPIHTKRIEMDIRVIERIGKVW